MYIFSIKDIKGSKILAVDNFFFTQFEVRIGEEVWILKMTEYTVDVMKMVLLSERCQVCCH